MALRVAGEKENSSKHGYIKPRLFPAEWLPEQVSETGGQKTINPKP